MHAVNLRNLLGAECRTIREEQDEESGEFLTLFDAPLMVVEGSRGETGFLHVEEKEVVVKLYRLFGQEKNLHIVSMPVHPLSLDSKFVYLVDGNSRLYVWIGAKSRLLVQTKGRLIAEKIATKERNGEAVIHIEPQGRESNEFWTVMLGLWTPPPCAPAPAVAEATDISKRIVLGPECADGGAATLSQQKQAEYDLLTKNYPKPPQLDMENYPPPPTDHIPMDWKLPKPILYDVKLGKGFLEIPQVDLIQQGLSKSLLNSRNVYMLDSGGELFVWIGDKAAKFLRYAGCKLAHELTELMPRGCFGGAEIWLSQLQQGSQGTSTTSLYRRPMPQICIQGAESQIFKAQFIDWECAMAVDFTRTADSVAKRGADVHTILERDKMKVDLRALLNPREVPLPWDEAMRF
ncbi:hypothetical protein Ciccas_011843, partial [Cichlidogyrus casuarinus]